MNTTISYKKNFVTPQPETAWVKPMTAATAGTQTTTAEGVNVVVDADTTEAPTENSNAVIFD